LPTSLHQDTHGYGKSNASRLASASSEFFNENLNTRRKSRANAERKNPIEKEKYLQKSNGKWIIENG